ncbi:MAG: hypothetical protein KatS3mg097_089 [Candidatus Parcubacteria bacterium]|nr:MAG: hypothetical protein KatS3mg097_089 [Candidatus Parcubacteria bacterium]
MEEQPIRERKEREPEGVVRITEEIREKIKYLSKFFKSRFLVYLMSSQAVFFTGKMGEVHARSLDRFLNNGPKIVEVIDKSNEGENVQLAGWKDVIGVRRGVDGRIKSIDLLGGIITLESANNSDPEERLLELAILAKKLTLEHNDINKIRNFFNRENATFTINRNNVRNLRGGYSWYQNNFNVIRDYTSHLITDFLGEAFNMRNVGDISSMDYRTRERGYARSNPEINQQTVPPKGTIEFPDYIVDNVSINLIPGYESGGSGTTLSIPRERFGTQGQRYEALRYVQAVITLDIYNSRTNERISIIAYGIPVPYSYNSSGSYSIFTRYFGIAISNHQNNYSQFAGPLAIANAIDNLKSIFCFSGKKELGYYEHFDPNSVPVTMVSFNKDNRPDSQT